ncbi:hypothetical protein AB0395_46930 [Streptosporangium sp. NPDC051023]|uniref:hypothetical protein n=1 Tax=Streptosporangium sp. NPDC051023 TaxID=3155410 RepID=UPI00344FC3EC
MTLSTEVKRLAESKPFYAVAGAGDFAVEKLRELPEQIQRLQGRGEGIREAARDLPEKAKEFAGRAPEKAREFADKAEGYAKDFPGKARVYADQFSVRAAELYEEFASRGRRVVSKTSGEAALELEEISESAEPATATQATRKNSRTPKNGPAAKV